MRRVYVAYARHENKVEGSKDIMLCGFKRKRAVIKFIRNNIKLYEDMVDCVRYGYKDELRGVLRYLEEDKNCYVCTNLRTDTDIYFRYEVMSVY